MYKVGDKVKIVKSFEIAGGTCLVLKGQEAEIIDILKARDTLNLDELDGATDIAMLSPVKRYFYCNGYTGENNTCAPFEVIKENCEVERPFKLRAGDIIRFKSRITGDETIRIICATEYGNVFAYPETKTPEKDGIGFRVVYPDGGGYKGWDRLDVMKRGTEEILGNLFDDGLKYGN